MMSADENQVGNAALKLLWHVCIIVTILLFIGILLEGLGF